MKLVDTSASSHILAVLCFLILAIASSSDLQAQPAEENQPYEPPDCIAEWDPFCPNAPGSGTGGTDGAGDAGDCFVCETGYLPGSGTAQVCVRASSGSSGRTVCDDGWLYTYCDLEGAFCEIITVSP